MALGGGIDIKIHRRFAIRAFQSDYLLTRFFNGNQHNFRLSAGFVWRIGASQ